MRLQVLVEQQHWHGYDNNSPFLRNNCNDCDLSPLLSTMATMISMVLIVVCSIVVIDGLGCCLQHHCYWLLSAASLLLIVVCSIVVIDGLDCCLQHRCYWLLSAASLLLMVLIVVCSIVVVIVTAWRMKSLYFSLVPKYTDLVTKIWQSHVEVFYSLSIRPSSVCTMGVCYTCLEDRRLLGDVLGLEI